MRIDGPGPVSTGRGTSFSEHRTRSIGGSTSFAESPASSSESPNSDPYRTKILLPLNLQVDPLDLLLACRNFCLIRWISCLFVRRISWLSRPGESSASLASVNIFSPVPADAHLRIRVKVRQSTADRESRSPLVAHYLVKGSESVQSRRGHAAHLHPDGMGRRDFRPQGGCTRKEVTKS